MNIGLYSEPTNESLPNYRGLYRQNGLIDFCDSSSHAVRKEIDWYFSNAKDGGFLGYSKETHRRVLLLYGLLTAEKWPGEIIAFTDKMTAPPTGAALLGYDICADSRYYSPLGDGFLEVYDRHSLFCLEMDENIFRGFQNALNANGLFSSYAFAQEFAEYCNYVNSQHIHAIESEENWRPFSVYRLGE